MHSPEVPFYLPGQTALGQGRATTCSLQALDLSFSYGFLWTPCQSCLARAYALQSIKRTATQPKPFLSPEIRDWIGHKGATRLDGGVAGPCQQDLGRSAAGLGHSGSSTSIWQGPDERRNQATPAACRNQAGVATLQVCVPHSHQKTPQAQQTLSFRGSAAFSQVLLHFCAAASTLCTAPRLTCGGSVPEQVAGFQSTWHISAFPVCETLSRS